MKNSGSFHFSPLGSEACPLLMARWLSWFEVTHVRWTLWQKQMGLFLSVVFSPQKTFPPEASGDLLSDLLNGTVLFTHGPDHLSERNSISMTGLEKSWRTLRGKKKDSSLSTRSCKRSRISMGQPGGTGMGGGAGKGNAEVQQAVYLLLSTSYFFLSSNMKMLTSASSAKRTTVPMVPYACGPRGLSSFASMWSDTGKTSADDVRCHPY